MSEACLSIVILTEDSGKDARATVEALVRKMLGLVVPRSRLHDRVAFLPREPREEEAMRGNVWKTDGRDPLSHERRVRLLRYIARRLCAADTFVIFHVDGDRPWAKRSTSENVAKFERLVVTALPHVVERGRATVRRARRSSGVSAEGDSAGPMLHIDRLLLLCPFRSIESWLYQNLDRAVQICRREHAGRHIEDLAGWSERRAELDELDPPEDHFCLRKDHNLELASRGFPADAVVLVGKSFARSVQRMRECADLEAALLRTCEPSPGDTS